MKTSDKGLLVIVVGYCIVHLSILFRMVPHNIVWGGKIQSVETLYALEGPALAMMLFLGAVLAMKNRMIRPIFTDKAIKRILWIFAVFFIFSTVGNLLAKTLIERIQAIISFFLAFTLFKSSKQIKSL